MFSTSCDSCLHVGSRIWKRKHFIFISIVLISLMITVAYTGVSLSTIFTRSQRQSSNKFETNSNIRQWKSVGKFDNNRSPSAFEANSMKDVSWLRSNHNQKNEQKQPETASVRYVPRLRLVHLDLKGAPPKLDYLKLIFPLLEAAGANGLLLELEDCFPFTGELRHAVTANAYTREDLQQIIKLAEEHNFELIPLIQTLGHMEYFLKLEKYRHLREIDEYPQAICPSRNESMQLVEHIVDQVLAMFPKSKWLHIGCDEVFHLGLCDRCKHFDREELFLSHVQKVSKYVKGKHNVTPIIWDDMLRTIMADKIQSFNFKKIGVEVMIWTYIDDIYRFISPSQWEYYSSLFDNVWGASAFKGAFGETLTVPDMKMHLDNNIAWLLALQEQDKKFQNIQGLVITGWQRYDHLGNLCELLAASLPSLMLDMLTVSNGRYDESVYKRFNQLMKCGFDYYNHNNIFAQDPNFFSKVPCKFPGASIFRVMQRLKDVQKRVDDYLYDKTIHKAWITDYNVRHNMSSPFRIEEALQDYNSVWFDLQYLLKATLNSFKEVYDTQTTYEWIEQKVYPAFVRMETFYNNTLALKKARVWPKRPLNSYDVIKRYLNHPFITNDGSR